MKINYKSLINHVKWIFSGIGVFTLSLIVTTCFSENINQTTIGRDQNIGRDQTNIGRDKNEYNSSGDNIRIERIIDNNGQYAEGDIHNDTKAPSYRKATIAYNKEGNPIGIADNQSPIQGAIKDLMKIFEGKLEDVKLEQASPSKFLVNSGTEISILEFENSSVPTGFPDIGFGKFVKIKILEGIHRDKTGWISASQIKTEERIITGDQ